MGGGIGHGRLLVSASSRSAQLRRYGAKMAYDYVSSGLDSDYLQRELYADDRRRNFEEYELATNARQAGNGESFVGGAGQGVSFGFGEEAMAGFGSLFSDRSYE